MLIRKEDAVTLVHAVIEKFQADHGISMSDKSVVKAEFFDKLIATVNSATNGGLVSDTFYRHYYLKLRSSEQAYVGYSLDYLNALSRYAYNRNFLDEFKSVDKEEEIVEFPPDHPSFPATPCIKIEFTDKRGVVYNNVWIKDEGVNPTGLIKDRKAHELFLFYKRELREVFNSGSEISLRRMSIISTGYAALSIQYRFRKAGLPDLKVLLPKETDKEIIRLLKRCGAEITIEDLRSQKFSKEKIKLRTNNIGGIDLTSAYEEIPEVAGVYYDWLSYEVLNLNPDYLITPYGSGEIYRNILETHHAEFNKPLVSKRYFGDKRKLKNCHFIGVRPESIDSELFCLVSYFESTPSKTIPNLINKDVGAYSKLYSIEEIIGDFNWATDLAKDYHINTGPSGIAGLIWLRQQNTIDINPDSKIVIINTGKIKEELFENGF